MLPMFTNPVTIDDVTEAAARLNGHVVRTPLLPAAWADNGRSVWLKPENLQPTGAFKLRGALNAVACLDGHARSCGVVTYSSGNHAQGLAWSARAYDVPAVVVMRSDAPVMKVEATRALGAEVLIVAPEDRKSRAAEVAAERRMVLVPPFDHRDVIAGQGTVGLEITEDVLSWNRRQDEPDAETWTGDRLTVLVPVGGGGLISGVAVAIKARLAAARVLAVEPELSADLAESLATGERVVWDSDLTGRTIADGVRTSVGEFTWRHIQEHVDGVVTVTEEAILEATARLTRGSRIIAEPTGALTTAAYLEHPERFLGNTTIAVVSGGNVEPELLSRLLIEPERRRGQRES